MNISCKIYSLSDELLSAIVEALITDPKGAIPSLKALRLSSSRFANLYPIPKFLFANIQLVPGAEHLQRLAQDDLRRIASLIKKVTFVAPSIYSKVQLGLISGSSEIYKQHYAPPCMPLVDDGVFVEPPEDWIINLENYKTTLLNQPIRRLAKHPWIMMRYYATCDRSSYDAHRRYWELRLETRDSQLDGQVRTELEKNHEDAQAARDLLLGDEITAAWTAVLRGLPHVHKWQIATVSREAREPHAWGQRPEFMVHPEEHGGKYRCYTYDEELGDALFAAAIRSLAKANARPHEFIVDCVMTGHFEWETLPGWQQLDLGNVQSFHFQPAVEHYNEDLNEIEGEENISPRAANAIAAVLKRCKDSLRVLMCKRGCPLQWPGSEIINLSELRFLYLDCCYCRPRNLCNWMARMPLLQNIEMKWGHPCEDSFSDSLLIFDAIRNQSKSKGARVRLLMIWTEPEVDIDYHTQDFEQFLEGKEQETSTENVMRKLQLYLSGKVDWNPSWLDEA